MISVSFASSEMLRQEMNRAFCKIELRKYGMESNTPFMDVCMRDPLPFFYGIDGFKKGLKHCKDNFRCHRWNCTTDEDHGFKLFGFGMARGMLLLLLFHLR